MNQSLTILTWIIRIQLRLSKAVASCSDLDFVYKQLLDEHKACKTTLSLTQYQRERLIGRTNNCFMESLKRLYYHLLMMNVSILSSYLWFRLSIYPVHSKQNYPDSQVISQQELRILHTLINHTLCHHQTLK